MKYSTKFLLTLLMFLVVSTGAIAAYNPSTNLLPIQTVTGTSKTFTNSDFTTETRRSNSGSAMTDTFPASNTAGLQNGTQITVNNVDATATDTITAGAGTSFSSGSTDSIGPGRSIRYVYDSSATTWRKTLNSGTSLLGPNNLSDVNDNYTARNNLGVGVTAYRPENFPPVYADKKRMAEPFLIESGSNKLQFAATYQFYGVGSSNGTTTVTFNFPNGSPPIHFSYLDNTTEEWVLFFGATFSHINSMSCAVGSTTCTATLANTVATNSNLDVTIWENGGTKSPGSPNMVLYDTVTTQNTTIAVSDAIPQSILDAARLAGDITSTNLINVTKVTTTHAWFNNGVGVSGADLGSQVQLNGAGASGGLYKGNIVAEDSTTVAYVYPRTSTALPGVQQYLLWGPYLFDPSDATSPAKYVQLPLVGATPASTYVGTAPLIAQISSVTDPFNVVLTANASASVPATVTATPIPGGNVKIGHSDLTPLTQAFQQCARNTIRGTHHVLLSGDYWVPDFNTDTHNAGTAFSSCIMEGNGTLEFPLGTTTVGMSYYFHGPGPRDTNNLQPIPVNTFNAARDLWQCNNNPLQCVVAFVGDSNFTQFTSGATQEHNWPVVMCDEIKAQLKPKNVICNFMGVGGSTTDDLDPAGQRAGIPAQRANNPWYPAATHWIDLVRDGTIVGSNAFPYPMPGCPDAIILKFTNNDGAGFKYGSLQRVIKMTQNSAYWGAGTGSCKTFPDIGIATSSEQTLGDPSMNLTTQVQTGNDYAALAMRGFANSCVIKLANGGCPGMIGDAARVGKIVYDGYDPQTIPMSKDDDLIGAGQNWASQQSLPFSYPGYVSDGLSWQTLWQYGPSTGTYTVLAATSFANNLSNANAFWANLGNEVDYTIGNPNGPNTSGGNTNTAFIDYPGNQVRLFYNQTSNGTTGSAAGMIDYEIDTFNYNITGVTGTSGTNTLTCAAAAACVNYKHLGASITGTNIPAGTTIGGVSTSGTTPFPVTITLTQADGLTASNLTGNVTSGQTLNVSMVQVPRKSTGQYGFMCQTSTGLNNMLWVPIFEFIGTRLVIANCGNPGPNLVEENGVIRFGGLFSPTFSVPGTPASLKIYNSAYGGIAGSTSKTAKPEHATFIAALAFKDGYGNCSLGALLPISRYDGQCASHISTVGQLLNDAAMKGLRLSTGQTIVKGVYTVTPTSGNTLTIPDGNVTYRMTPAGTLASLTLTMPANFPANQTLKIYTSQAVTSFTLSANTGQTFFGATPTSLTAGQVLKYFFDGSQWWPDQ
jgi:hypothetical protein